MSNYEAMTDFEVNKAVAEALGVKTMERYDALYIPRIGDAVLVDYCNKTGINDIFATTQLIALVAVVLSCDKRG